ncbi:MAG: TadE/TadG family type IV pilus assembly protein [Nitratireductor sp.]
MITKFRKFLQDTGAAYGPLFAILTVPLFGTAAAAVEYSRLIDTKSNIQNALDAAALATGKELSASSDRAYLEQYARNFFDANLDNNIKPGDVTFALNFWHEPTGGNTVRLTANYDQRRPSWAPSASRISRWKYPRRCRGQPHRGSRHRSRQFRLDGQLCRPDQRLPASNAPRSLLKT